MHLSRLIINNYRSIKELDLRFERGKNVVVGKNNAGKSNIVKAIDLLLGESSPTYEKSENICENDFCNSNIEKPIIIFCELERDNNEELNYNELYKSYGFYRKNERIKLDQSTPNNFIKNIEEVFSLNPDEEKNKTYINPKLKNQKTFESEFGDKYNFAYAFYAFLDKEKNKIIKNILFFYRETNSRDWLLSFKANIRNELLQSAIIPSFRDPQNQLRISNWSWYGKLLKQYVDSDNKKLKDAFQEVKNVSNEIFAELQGKINHSKVKVAFPDTDISFQFNPDTKQDVYKSALIYIDDGFISQLQDKGSGIQSAIIIGLFHFYAREIAHTGSSLLAIEEPELYLHPHGRRIISDRLDDFLEGNKNQVIITTHASEFLNSAQENLNIIVVKKDAKNGTTAKNIEFKTAKEKQILIKNQNTEMFFADLVILVEGGGDKYIVEALAENFGSGKKYLGEKWLNDNNISVITVGGKKEFWKYSQKLNEAGIEHFVLADFDFFRNGLSDYLTKLNFTFLKTKHNTINGKVGSQKNFKKIDDLFNGIKNEVAKFIDELKKDNVFILNGELENYYTQEAKKVIIGLSGKEERALHIVSQTFEEGNVITKYIMADEYNAFFDLTSDKYLKVKDKDVKKEKSIIEIEDLTIDELPF